MYTPTNSTHNGWMLFIHCETEEKGPGKGRAYHFNAFAELPLTASERHGDKGAPRVDLPKGFQTVYDDPKFGEEQIRKQLVAGIDDRA